METYIIKKKGETVNFYSRISIYPEQNIGVFISFNNYVDEDHLDAMMDEVTNLVLGRVEKIIYKGKQTANISGYYVSTRSNFNNPEKILNLLTPDKVFCITGDINKGFRMDKYKLNPIGENYYSTPMGNLKYVETSNNVYLANKTATSYVRANWHESNIVQIFVVASFVFFSIVIATLAISNLFCNNRSRLSYFFAGLSTVHLASFIIMCILIYRGLSSYNILALAPSIKIFGILTILTSLTGALYTVYLLIYKEHLSINILLLIVWNISNILFYLWIMQVNII